jgi:hypothetical protein
MLTVKKYGGMGRAYTADNFKQRAGEAEHAPDSGSVLSGNPRRHSEEHLEQKIASVNK